MEKREDQKIAELLPPPLPKRARPITMWIGWFVAAVLTGALALQASRFQGALHKQREALLERKAKERGAKPIQSVTVKTADGDVMYLLHVRPDRDGLSDRYCLIYKGSSQPAIECWPTIFGEPDWQDPNDDP